MSEPVRAALRRGAALLDAAGVAGAAHEARLLLAHALGATAADLIDPARPVVTGPYDALLARRAAREPLAHITGRQGFWTLDLAVGPATLIPRADSEAVIEAATACFPDRAGVARILDLGTGTGCLLLAGLAEFPDATGVGIDLSPAAARIAARNAVASGMAGRAAIMVGRWSDALAGRFDLVLSNPPYIRTTDLAGLMPEVSRHEPRLALDGGADGLDAYRDLLPRLPGLLTAQGRAVLEIGAGQEPALRALAACHGLQLAATHHDLGGHARAIVLEET